MYPLPLEKCAPKSMQCHLAIHIEVALCTSLNQLTCWRRLVSLCLYSLSLSLSLLAWLMHIVSFGKWKWKDNNNSCVLALVVVGKQHDNDNSNRTRTRTMMIYSLEFCICQTCQATGTGRNAYVCGSSVALSQAKTFGLGRAKLWGFSGHSISVKLIQLRVNCMKPYNTKKKTAIF